MMQFNQGTPVVTADGQEIGHVDRVVVEPDDQEVTDIVVRKGMLLPEDKVIPIELIKSATADQVTLILDADHAKSLLPFEELHYLASDEEYMSASQNEVSTPLYWYPPIMMTPGPTYPY